MARFGDLRALILALPGTVETLSRDSRSFKVNGGILLCRNAARDCPVFKVPVEERDLLITADPDTFFTPDHHRPRGRVLARPGSLDPGWARADLERIWRARAKRAELRAIDARGGAGAAGAGS